MKRILFTMMMATASLTMVAQGLPYQNPNLSAKERAADLCSRLTLEENLVFERYAEKYGTIPTLVLKSKLR